MKKLFLLATIYLAHTINFLPALATTQEDSKAYTIENLEDGYDFETIIEEKGIRYLEELQKYYEQTTNGFQVLLNNSQRKG